MTSEEYGQYIDDFELGADVMPGESLTEYIERRRREFESKADGGVIGIEVKIADEMAKGGRVGLFSGGALKGLASLFKGGKDKIDEIIETKSKEYTGFRRKDDIPVSTYSEMEGPIKISDMENIPKDQLQKILRTQELGLYEETPEILKAANLLERFTKKVKGKRVIDYERAEDILGVKLKGNETLDELFKIEFQTRPENRLTDSPFKDFEEYVLKGEKKADGGRVGLFMGGPALEGQALQIYNSMKGYNFSDQEIADTLSARGLYTPPGSGSTTQPNIIGAQLDQGGGGGGGSFPIGSISQTSTPTSGYKMSTFTEDFAPSGEVNLIPGKTSFTGTGLIGDFMAANEARNRKLVKPGKIAQFAYNAGLPKQRSVQEMIESGQIDQRKLAGIPTVGNIMATVLPDKYFDMSLEDQVFTQSQMGYDGPTVFGENTIGNKDPFGINVRSAFGNYADYVTNRVAELEAALEKAKDKYTTDGVFNQNQYLDMTKYMRNELQFRKAQEKLKQDQAKRIEEARQKRIDEERKAGRIANHRMQRQAGGGGGGNLTRSRSQGGLGLSASQAQAISEANRKAGMGGYGLKDGGLATMFTRRR